MHKVPPPITPAPSPVSSCTTESVAASNYSIELKILATLSQQLAACTATAGALFDLLLSKGMGAVTLADSDSLFSSTSSLSFVPEDEGIVPTRPPKVQNPKGPIDKFVPGGLSLDGFRQHMYNGFIFDVPPKDTDGTVYVVTRGHRVGIFTSWTVASPYVNKCKGNAFVSAPTVDDGFTLMMDAVDNGTACWLKG
ncbi:hypothetical protein EV363DRAFT_1176294 [Boletus edulis]|nr:hypothetical protein EV363DRAFT_1409927 [Boletus edulis]KAF8120047.1 hypothetical protein EV363DRAFT_1460277 [Boletus edulis]KAF8120231.1 hypothetical protein EV363DRAFT_1191627 [Boletus edulis]KAF8123632.1 hypothetical protein EV363DRAFT_1403867 [Boletus edulis]KAF8125347.1 hypothetical protein EV363DRAFT_1176150 [Boletus edulis]